MTLLLSIRLFVRLIFWQQHNLCWHDIVSQVWIPFNGLFFQLLGYIRRQEAAAGIKSEGVLMDAGNSAVAAAAAGWVTTPIGARFIVCCSQTGSMVATSDHCVAIWADVVKTRLQVSGANAQVFAYKGYIDCGAILFWLQACHAAAL